MGQLEGLRGSDGKFHFKLCYPELNHYSFPCNEWLQTSNPATESTITGYQGLHVTFGGSGYNHAFGGLAVSPPSVNETWIDATPPSWIWWYAIGCFKYHNGKPNIPGPVDSTGGYSITKVELYVQIGVHGQLWYQVFLLAGKQLYDWYSHLWRSI